MDMKIDLEFQMGAQVATLHASTPFGEFAGAHVEVLGRIVADTWLVPVDPADPGPTLILQAVRALRDAHRNCEMPFDTDLFLATLRSELGLA